MVYPFVSTNSNRSLFSKSSHIKIGYKYQLQIQGLPCFESHTVVVEESIQKEVNEELMNMLQGKAIQFAQAAVDAKAGAVGKAVFSVANAVIHRK